MVLASRLRREILFNDILFDNGEYQANFLISKFNRNTDGQSSGMNMTSIAGRCFPATVSAAPGFGPRQIRGANHRV